MQNNLFEKYGLKISDQAISDFEKYREMILEYNKVMDITNILEYDEMYIKHFIDSLYLDKSKLKLDGKSLIDIGTGGGFPGIPLKLVYRDMKVTLLDSLKKRIGFLDQIIEELNLSSTEAVHGRAEELARDDDFRERYDFATSRAVAQLRTLVEYCLGFVKPGGYFIAMKGPNFEDELEDAKNAIHLMGGKLEDVIVYDLPEDFGQRSLIVIKKVKNTSSKYPRGQGKPKSKPL